MRVGRRDYKGEFRASYSKSTSKTEATAAPKVYCTGRSSTGPGGPALD